VKEITCIHVDKETMRMLRLLKIDVEYAAGRRVTWSEFLRHLADFYKTRYS
jgi:hypothetical protein